MDRKDFLEGLRRYLAPEVSAEVVQENIRYYERYITEEVIKGRREEEIVEELGDPWVLAKTIIDMQGSNSEYEEVYEAKQEKKSSYGNVKSIQIDSWWKKIGMILCIVGVLFVIFSVVTGIIRFLLPIILPLFLIVTLYRLIFGQRR